MKFIDSIREWPAEDLSNFVAGVAETTTNQYLSQIIDHLDETIAKIDVGPSSMLLSMVNQYIKEVQKSVPAALKATGYKFTSLLLTECEDVEEYYEQFLKH